MGKKGAFFLAAAGILYVFSASLLSAQTDCPSCSTFGIQLFQEKKVAPSFSLKMVDGKQAALSDFKGKPVLFIFWASWCSACKEEMALIEKFSQGKKDQLTIFTVAIDGENEKRIKRIIRDQKINLPVLLDIKEKIARTYGIKMVPTVFLIDPEGRIVGTIVGQRDWESPAAWSAMRELFSLY
ncbi:MAG TPA: TlpA disulfide reductase family protein [Thermodesulfobacteriota bacterium]|nr:TlpA disulfide reductase family protein [Thermodesulfobacteriota bacterium]